MGSPEAPRACPGCCPWHRWGVESWGSERRRRRHRPRCPGQGQRITRLGPRPRARGGQAGGPGLRGTEGRRPCHPVQREARAGHTSHRTVSERGAQAVLSWGSATPGAGVALCRGDSGSLKPADNSWKGWAWPRFLESSPGAQGGAGPRPLGIGARWGESSWGNTVGAGYAPHPVTPRAQPAQGQVHGHLQRRGRPGRRLCCRPGPEATRVQTPISTLKPDPASAVGLQPNQT